MERERSDGEQSTENRVDKELAVEQKSRRGLYEYYRLNVAKNVQIQSSRSSEKWMTDRNRGNGGLMKEEVQF